VRERERDDTGVEVRFDDQPIVGVKYAQLVAVDDRLCFAPAFPRPVSKPYHALADAVCESEHRHAAPALRCHCGFHAVGTTRELWRVAPAVGGVVLDVELAGIVVEHRRGWRAANQAVLGVHLPTKCARFLCRRPTAGVAPYRTSRTLEAWPWVALRPVCTRCARRHGIPIADLASRLGVEVTVDERRPERRQSMLATLPGSSPRP
jgi:hypothetical protein